MHRVGPAERAILNLLDSLPPARSMKWRARDKAAVVLAVRNGTLSLSEAFDRYQLSAEELRQWEEAFDRDGIAGLQVKAFPAALTRRRGS